MCQIIARWCWLGGREKRRKIESYDIDSCSPTADYSKMCTDEQDLSSSKVHMHKSTYRYFSLCISIVHFDRVDQPAAPNTTIQTIQTWNFVLAPVLLFLLLLVSGYTMRRVGSCPSRILSRAFIYFFFLDSDLIFFLFFSDGTRSRWENRKYFSFFFDRLFFLSASHTHTIKNKKSQINQTTSWPVKRSSHWAVIIMDGWPIYSIISNPSYRIQVLHHLTLGPRSGGSIDIFWTADRHTHTHTERERWRRDMLKGVYKVFVRLIE